MMRSGNRLPFEILLKIFDYVRDNKQQLGECRLACKSWNPIAEKVLFKQVEIKSDSARKLYNCLVQNPRLAKHIQDIQRPILILGGYYHEDPATLLELIRTSTAKPLELEQLHLGFPLSEEYVELLSHFKDTLNSTSFNYSTKDSPNIEKAIIRFPQFKNLTELKIDDFDYEDGNIQQYENLLRGFVCLETLHLKVKAMNAGHRSSTIFKAWLSRNVQKDQSLSTLRVHLLFRKFDASFLEYLSFKYPNIKHLSMKGNWLKGQCIYPMFANVNSFHLNDWTIECLESVHILANIWKRQSNSVQLRFSGMSGINRCRMDIKKEKHKEDTKFIFKSIDCGAPLENFVSVLSIFRGSALKTLDIDMVDNYYTYKNTYPSDLIRAGSSVEHLKLTAKCLHLKKRLDLAHLRTVELVNTDLTTEDITHLGLSAPSLRNVVFTSCSFDKETCQDNLQGDRIIDLSSNQLETLTLKSSRSPQSNANKVYEISIIHVFVGELKHYFSAKPSSSPSLQLPRQEHVHYSTPSDVLTIKCKSLQSLKVDLGNVKFDVQFDAEGKIKEKNDL